MFSFADVRQFCARLIDWRGKPEEVATDASRRAFLTRALLATPTIALSPLAARALEELFEPRIILLPPTVVDFSAELARITRSAFIPQLIVQIYNTSPLMAAMLADAKNFEPCHSPLLTSGSSALS